MFWRSVEWFIPVGKILNECEPSVDYVGSVWSVHLMPSPCKIVADEFELHVYNTSFSSMRSKLILSHITQSGCPQFLLGNTCGLV